MLPRDFSTRSRWRFFFFQAEDGIRDKLVTGVQTCALPISGLPPVPAGGDIPDRGRSAAARRPARPGAPLHQRGAAPRGHPGARSGDAAHGRPAHPRRDPERARTGAGGRDDAVVRPGAHPHPALPRQGVQPRRQEQHPAVPRAATDSANPNRPHHDPVPAEPGVLSVADGQVPRRTFFTASVAGVAGAGLTPSFPLSTLWRGGQGVRSSAPPEPLRLGVASYSLRNFPRDKAIAMVRALGARYINLKSVHLPFELSPAELAAARQEIAAAGLVIVGGGVITFEHDSDEDVGKYFAYAEAAGMPLITAHADAQTLPRIERFAKQYDIKVAIHNHGPEDKRFPSPYDALKHVKTMDRRMGLCIDIGHTVRTGSDVVQAVADAGPRHDVAAG